MVQAEEGIISARFSNKAAGLILTALFVLPKFSSVIPVVLSEKALDINTI